MEFVNMDVALTFQSDSQSDNITCKIVLFKNVQLEHTKSDDLVRIPFGAKDLVKIL
jgi:hypothetical protein